MLVEYNKYEKTIRIEDMVRYEGLQKKLLHVNKRFFDLVSSIVAICVFCPIMLLISLAIVCYDGGPVIYKQERLTYNGKVFRILKFRSMCVDAEEDGVARLSKTDDERVTPIGNVLRKYWLDELPQLFNVLRGDMSIVGPRPERPEIAEQYIKCLPEFNLRLQVKAGLTGLAQICGNYYTPPEEKLRYDLVYINNMSMIKDIQIILLTVVSLVKKMLPIQ